MTPRTVIPLAFWAGALLHIVLIFQESTRQPGGFHTRGDVSPHESRSAIILFSRMLNKGTPGLGKFEHSSKGAATSSPSGFGLAVRHESCAARGALCIQALLSMTAGFAALLLEPERSLNKDPVIPSFPGVCSGRLF